MVWAYIQIASLLALVAFIVYIGIADARITKEGKRVHRVDTK